AGERGSTSRSCRAREAKGPGDDRDRGSALRGGGGGGVRTPNRTAGVASARGELSARGAGFSVSASGPLPPGHIGVRFISPRPGLAIHRFAKRVARYLRGARRAETTVCPRTLGAGSRLRAVDHLRRDPGG